MSWNSEEERWRPERPLARWEAGMLDLFLGMLRLPVALLAVGAEMAAGALREMRRASAAERVTVVTPPRARPEVARRDRREAADAVPSGRAAESANPGGRAADTEHESKEKRAMPDTNLSDDMVKLVRYTIVSIKRDEEGILVRGEEVFDDNMSDDAFATWVISKHVEAGGLPADDRKYLRVSYEVLERWPRQDGKYDSRKIRVLEEIRDRLP